jgi:hypothetical protein
MELDLYRFLSGGETVDMTGSAGIRMIQLGTGRAEDLPRTCHGDDAYRPDGGTNGAGFRVERAPVAAATGLIKDKMEFTVVMDLPLLAAVKPRNLSF